MRWTVYYKETGDIHISDCWSELKSLEVEADTLSEARDRALVHTGHGVTQRVKFTAILPLPRAEIGKATEKLDLLDAVRLFGEKL